MAGFKILFAITLLLVLSALKEGMAHKKHDELRKRSVEPEDKKAAAKEEEEDAPSWKPATGPRQFTVAVADKINGAHQQRHESWNNGKVEGSYAAPGRNGKWLKYDYVGDAKGFRITSTKEVSADELMGAGHAADKQAQINITSDDKPVHYVVTEEQLKQAKAQQEKVKINDSQ